MKTTAITTTRQKRGFFGWFWLILFLAFEALMIWTIFINFSLGGEVMDICAGDGNTEAACSVGAGIGVALIGVMGWFIWIAGTMFLGLMVLVTRGKTVAIMQVPE